MKNAIKQVELIDIYKAFIPKKAKYTTDYFCQSQRKLSNHPWGQEKESSQQTNKLVG